MKVIRAEAMGLCFGVRDALEFIEGIERPRDVTVYGELVHNPKVNGRLVQLGFRQMNEAVREKARVLTSEVLVTAHGISNRERARLEREGHHLHDTTCPLVRRAHDAALALDAAGCFVIVVGRRGHVETLGLTGDLRAGEIVESPAEVRSYSADRIGIVCQTTTPDALARAVVDRVKELNPGKLVRFVDTVCRPTRERQQALDALLPRVDALIVVGGKNSRNTRELAESAAARGVRSFHVEKAADLDPAWFAGCETAGLTAGTSTLDDTIEEVYSALVAIGEDSRKPQEPIHGLHGFHGFTRKTQASVVER